MNDQDLAIDAQGIFKTFDYPEKVDILRGLSLQVPGGSSVAIMGKSGEGKSTLLHILGTLEKATSGTLHLLGKDPYNSGMYSVRNAEIGFIFQAYNLLEGCSVIDNILMPAKIARKDVSKGGKHYNRALMLMEDVGLLHRKDLAAKKLSGGEKQRAAIARALCLSPAIILADEPSGNLDHATSKQIHDLLISLTKKENKTLVVVTHDAELASLCDLVYQLKEGKLFLQQKEPVCIS